jgi:dipeptidyl aminopeptidase/acylaminoacyl peptidase
MPIRYVIVLALLPALAAAASRPFDVDDLVRLDRISDPQLSPDGKRLVYTVRHADVEANQATQALYELDLSRKNAEARRLTGTVGSAFHPRWAGDKLYFLSTRSGSAQVYVLDGPGEARPVTALPIAVDGFQLSPDGRHLLIAAEIYPECGADFACTKQRSDDEAARKATGTRHSQLFIRHWDTWKRGMRRQLFVLELGSDGVATGAANWVSRAVEADVPTRPFGDMGDVAFAPDGQSLVFVARLANASEAWSTNTDLYRVSLADPRQVENLTPLRPGYDTSPVFSPDGRKLYYLSMERAGYEADRNRIIERDLQTGAEREVAPGWDRSPGGLTLSADGRTLYTATNDLGHHPVFAIRVQDGRVTRLGGAGNASGFAVGKDALYAVVDRLDSPAQIYALPLQGGTGRALTRHNAERLGEIAFGDYEQFSFKGWNDETVYGWVVKPVGYQAGQRYPVAFIVHGGPQGSMGNSFHYRWNPQTYAGKGFAVVFIDFHGSTGYGQAFTDSIRGDWGGKPLVDLQKGWAAALERYDFLDGRRACALGASYGGYMMNWIAGAWPDGFRCIVNHAGIFDNRFMAYTTEELFFDEWEFEGTQFEHPENYEQHNPVNRVAQWRTPMLVTHGMLDFRVPFEQGIATFTALQRRGIPSEFLWFPDENHWILKPQNSVQWHRAVEAWLKRWTDEAAMNRES